MKTRIVCLAASVAIALGGTISAEAAVKTLVAAPAQVVSLADVQALQAQLQVLQDRLTQMEQAQLVQAAKVAEAAKVVKDQVLVNNDQQAALDNVADNLARTVGEGASSGWMGRWVWKGDFRYRNENIDQEYTERDRNRDRMRLRLGATARVNDTVKVVAQFTTGEGGDARAPNQTLTDANSRKAIYVDTAYGEWAPTPQFKATIGKQPSPWVRTSSYFYDGDVNPEGIAASWQQAATGFFGSAWLTRLAERSAKADSDLLGLQVGYRNNFGDGGRYLLAAGYFDYSAVQGYNVIQSGISSYYGNSTQTTALTTVNPICRSSLGVAPQTCLANDFDIIDLVGELQIKVAGQPLLIYGNYAQNNKAKFAFVSNDLTKNIKAGLDTAHALGFTFGKVALPGSWEVGYVYQRIEKDSLYGQLLDSDYGAGNTDAKGGALRFGYQFDRNFRFNTTYFMNQTNIDLATGVSAPFSGAVGATSKTIFDRDYNRLQLDLNYLF
ncbi:MAG: hypothetical protein EXR88_00120 [Gammaproteobacteria bacterium]|nr:hypothetical protein [Gammaproteobacteria bacterium]